MFTVTVPQLVIDASEQLVNAHSFNLSGHFNASHEQQLAGVVGENMIRHHFGIDLMEYMKSGDGGWDIEICGCKVDVKVAFKRTTLNDYRMNCIVNAREIQKYNPDSYIWTRLFKDKLTILGGSTKKHFLTVAKFYDKYSTIFIGEKGFNVSSPMYSAWLEDVTQFHRWQDLEDEPPNIQQGQA